MAAPLAISFGDVEAAAVRVAPHVHHTPVLTSRTADERLQAQLFFKCENLQRGGAFKARGGFNALLQLSDDQRSAGVITFSSGNHAQAIGLAGKKLGIPTVVVMPRDAPAAKIAATRAYGAEVVL